MSDSDFQLRTIRGDRRVLRERMRSICEESEPSEEEDEEEERKDNYRARLFSLLTNGLEEEFLRQLAQCSPADLDAAEGGGDGGDGGGSGGGGGSLLQRAARAGLARAAAALVRAGADPNACSAVDAEPPLVAAARLGHDAVLQALLRAGRPLQVDAADARGDTALHLAAGGGRARAVALLLRAGADAGRRNRRGQPALSAAEAQALLDFCVRSNDAQGEDFEIELDFNPLTPALGCSEDYNTKSPLANIVPLETEMSALHRLTSTKHLSRELDHPIIHVFLEMKLCSMGALAYLNAEFHMVYTFLTILFSVSAACFSAERDSKLIFKPMSFCTSENASITFFEEVFRPVCVQNFIYDPVWFTVLGVVVFALTLLMTVCKICQCLKGSLPMCTYIITSSLWYFNLLFITLRIITNHLGLPSYFFGHVPAVLSSFILIEQLFHLPVFSYSINLFKFVVNKSWVFFVPYCAILFGITVSFYIINIIVHTINYLNNSPQIYNSEIPIVILNIFPIDPETRIFSIKILVSLGVLIALITANTMMSIASSKIEKIDTKLMCRVQHDKILFVMESESLIISIHNCLVRFPFVPNWIVYLFKSAVLFSPENRTHSCKATWNNLTKILIAKLPNGREYHLPIELSDKVMKIVAENNTENSSPDIITPDVLENELCDLEKSIKDRLCFLQNDIRSFITEQNFLLKDLIQELNNTSQYSQTGDSYVKQFIPEQLNVWQKQMRVYNSALSENINNSHANLQSGFGRLEKTLGEMMIQLDTVFKTSSEQNTHTHFEESKEENEV